jgi:hypothetical protein
MSDRVAKTQVVFEQYLTFIHMFMNKKRRFSCWILTVLKKSTIRMVIYLGNAVLAMVAG